MVSPYPEEDHPMNRMDRVVEVSATEASTPAPREPSEERLSYGHPSHAEVCIQLTACGVLLLERDPQLGDAIQLQGDDGGGLLCSRCPPTEYDWLVRTALHFGPDNGVKVVCDVGRHKEERSRLDSLVLVAHTYPVVALHYNIVFVLCMWHLRIAASCGQMILASTHRRNSQKFMIQLPCLFVHCHQIV
jgi:hypothetical protein